MSDHAKFAPSASSRWIPCNASVDFVDDAEPGDAAQFGTEVHAWIAAGGGLYPDNWTPEQRGDAALCLIEWRNHVPTTAQSEVRLVSKSWPELLFGTIDTLWADDRDCANLADLKTGLRGVNANDNSQLMVYAFLVSENFPHFKSFNCTIVQPRRQYVESSHYTLAQIQAFGKRIAAAIDSQPRFSAGSHCEFCPGRDVCSTLHNSLFGLLREASELGLWDANLAGKTEFSY